MIVVDRVASAMVEAMRRNLIESRGGSDDSQFAPIISWDRIKFRSQEDGRRRVSGDRSGSDVPLVDTGKLLKSVKIGNVRFSPVTSDGRRGRSYEITIVGAEHGLKFTTTNTFRDVLFGRTKAIRAAGNFGDLREGYDYVVKDQLTVPGRPWNSVSRTRLQEIANNAVRIAAGI